MNFDELLKEAQAKDKQGKAKAKVTLGSVGTKKTLPIPLASPSKAGEDRAESALIRSQKTPVALAEEKSVVKLLPRAIGAGLASGGLNVARAIPSTIAASLADGGTSKRYEESNQYLTKPVNAKQMELANKIADIAKNISYPGAKLDTFISDTQKDVGELKTPGNRIFAQALMAGGQMAPAIATGLVAGPAIGMSAFGSQVYGGAFKEALDRGADTKTAGDYALGQTLLEVGTETLVGGIPGLGKGLISKLAKSAGAKNLAAKAGIDATGKLLGKATNALFASRTGKALLNALGEGGEEVIAEYLSPFIERATIDPNAPDATTNQSAEAFAIGVLMSFFLQGGGINLSDGRTVTAEDVQTLNKAELNEVEDELYRLARESNIRKGKITPDNAPIEGWTPDTMANVRGLPLPKIQQGRTGASAKLNNNLAKKYTKEQMTGYIDGGVYENMDFIHRPEQYPQIVKALNTKLGRIELRQSNEKLQYVKTDSNGEILRDDKGMALLMSDEEMVKDGLRLLDPSVVAFNEKGESVGYSSDEWGADGVWVKPEYQKQGIGTELLYELKKQFNDSSRKIGQMTDAGMKMSGSYYRKHLADKKLPSNSKLLPKPTDIYAQAKGQREMPRAMFPGELPRVLPKTAQTIPTMTQAEAVNRPVQARTVESGTLPSPQNELETQDLGVVGIPSEKTAKYAETVQEFETVSKELSDEIINTIQQGKLEGTFKSNKAVVENANNYIAQGLQNARGAFDVSINDNRYTSESIALGARLVQEYQKIGDLQNAMSVLSDLAFALQAAGQKVQAAKILKKLTPEGRLKTLATLKNKIEAETGVQVELSDEILKQVSEAKTENEMAKAFGNARIEIWNKIPATFEDKFNAWRYTSMLGNPKTIMRNEIGNALFAPVRTVKNIIASGLEKVARIPSGANALEDNIERFIETGKTGSIRTKSILTNTDKDLVQFALKDAENVLEILKGDSKYGDLGSAEALTSRPIGTKVFNQDTILGRAIQKWSDVTTKALEDGLSVGNFKIIQGDASWLERIYSKSLAQFMKANNLNESDMKGIVLDIGRAYAIQEAKKGTYRDANIVSSWLSKNIRKGTKSDKLIPKAIGYIAEGAIPFKRTPMNIARRAIEYSPIGLINGVASTVQSIKNGENISVALDKLAAGLTRTGVIGLGMFLASLGLLSGGDSGDDKEEKYKDALGIQNYALQIGDKSYTIDWAAPSSIPLFVGVELYSQLKNGFELSDMLDAMKNVSDPLLEMSMLQGIANIMDTGYSQGGFDVILTPIKTSALSLAGQAVPTVFGQIARTIDPSLRRTNTSDAKSPALKDIEYGLKRNILSKIPVAQQTRQPYVDLWGRSPVKTSAGDYIKSALENFLSVGYASEENITSVDRQIISIYKDTEDNSVIPRSTTGYDIKVAGEEYRMSEDEKTEFQKTRGKQSYNKLRSLFLTNEYGKMTTEERVKAINDVYDDAYEVAKKQLAISRGMKEIDYNINTLPKESKAKIDSIVSAGIPKNTAYNIFTKKDANGNGSLSQDELMQVISLSKTTQKQKAALWDILKVQTWKKQNPFLQ